LIYRLPKFPAGKKDNLIQKKNTQKNYSFFLFCLDMLAGMISKNTSFVI
jgi:hypothetical protein